MAEGSGKLEMSDGSVYTGDFLRGREHGKGIIKQKDGTVFEGEFKNGKKDGEFVEKDAYGKITRKGTFKNGRLLDDKKM